jgi:hypothetical protein
MASSDILEVLDIEMMEDDSTTLPGELEAESPDATDLWDIRDLLLDETD